MARASLYKAMQEIGRPVFTTAEMAAMRGASVPTTTQALRRLEAAEVVCRVARGIWAVPSDPRFNVHALVSLLAGTHQAYVSFLSALRLHGMIEQIPQVVYAASTGHSRFVRTPVGAFSFHHLEPGFFAGFGWYGTSQSFLVAEPEKALIDGFYVSSRKGNRFRHLPELDLASFDLARAHGWIQRVADLRIQTYVRSRLDALFEEG